MSAQGNVSHRVLAEIIDNMPTGSETQELEYNIARDMFESCVTFIKYLETFTTEIQKQKNTGRVLPTTMGVIVGNGERYLAELYAISTKIETISRDFHMSSKLLSSIMEILQKTIPIISIKHFHIVEISTKRQLESKLLQKTYILGILNYFKETSNNSLGELYRALTEPTLATPIEKSAEKSAEKGGGDMKKKRGHGKRRHITHKRTKTRRKPVKTKKQRTRK